MTAPHAELPSEVSDELGVFDRFATAASNLASRAVFFVLCVALIAIWVPSILVIGNVDTWQLIINTATTIVTFLMVALLQNSQTRSDMAVHHKLNALAEGLACLMDTVAHGSGDPTLRHDVTELRDAVGLEDRESSSHNARAADVSA